jgi:hypothetical protein
MKACFQKVSNDRKGITINTIRHAFNDWISENFNQFSDNQLNEIAIDVGDSPKLLPSNLRYRFQIAENADMEKTEIEGNIQENAFIRNMVEAQAEEEGSIGEVEQNRDIPDADEIQSPTPITLTTNTELDVLYTKLAKAQIEVKTIEIMILRKLGVLT